MNAFRRIIFGLVFSITLASAATAQQTTSRFDYAGFTVQHFIVPAGVSRLSAIVAGASGGQTNGNIARPGGGGIVVATLSVKPGQNLSICVGGNGNGPTGHGEGGIGVSDGGARGDAGSSGFDAGGGGGGSAIALGADCFDLVTTPPLLIVAGGGGGGGGNSNSTSLSAKTSVVAGAGGGGGNPGAAGDANLSESPFAAGFGGCGGGAANNMHSH